MIIREDDLQGPEIAKLLDDHLEFTAGQSPPESMHALDLDGLRAPGTTFWTAWEGPGLLGCGALKVLDPSHGEIKSMHTTQAHRGEGIAAFILGHIIDEARQRSFRRLSLETGSMEAFAPSRALYSRFGFEICGPFASYIEDPYSVYMTREL
jgi:putative acetyltransferase